MPRIIKPVAIALSLCLLVIFMFLKVHNFFWPTDWVSVTVHNFPENLIQFYVIAESAEGTRALNYYVVSEGFPMTLEPRWNEGSYSDRAQEDLQWPSASRFGAVGQRKDGSWLLLWFEPSDFDRIPRSLWFGGENDAEITLPDESKATTPNRDFLNRLGVRMISVLKF